MLSIHDELQNFDYDYNVHAFDKGVIAGYYNIDKYPCVINEKFITIRQNQRLLVLVLDKNLDPNTFNYETRKRFFKSEIPLDYLKNKNKDVVYDLQRVFEKGIPGAANFWDKKEVSLATNDDDIEYIFNNWRDMKLSDSKLYTRTFNPNRYLRSFYLDQKGYKLLKRIIKINNKPYGVIAFNLNEKQKRAYELGFCSLFLDKETKLSSRQNYYILLTCLKELYQMGYKTVNMGTAGEKGLMNWKGKVDYNLLTFYQS